MWIVSFWPVVDGLADEEVGDRLNVVRERAEVADHILAELNVLGVWLGLWYHRLKSVLHRIHCTLQGAGEKTLSLFFG